MTADEYECQLPEPVAWRVSNFRGYWAFRRTKGGTSGWKHVDPLYSAATVADLKAKLAAAEAERDAANLRLKVYQEPDAEINAEFVRISDARAEAAETRLKEAKKVIAPFAYAHPNGAIWRLDNYPAGMEFDKDGWFPLYVINTQ